MGHLRLGRLPKTLRWREVVGLIEADPTDAARITGATVVAAETHLRSLPGDDSLTYAFWLLLRIATASRSDTFAQDVRGLGLSVTADTSALALIGEVAHRFFANFTARLLSSYLARELSNHVEGSIAERDTVAGAIDLHARQSAAIMREFAGGWYSKKNWETQGDVKWTDVPHLDREMRGYRWDDKNLTQDSVIALAGAYLETRRSWLIR